MPRADAVIHRNVHGLPSDHVVGPPSVGPATPVWTARARQSWPRWANFTGTWLHVKNW